MTALHHHQDRVFCVSGMVLHKPSCERDRSLVSYMEQALDLLMGLWIYDVAKDRTMGGPT